MPRSDRPAAKRIGGPARLRERVRRLPGGRIAWRIGVTLVGVAVIAGGIVLLPLPGPGWLIIFAGLGILATEYPWAARLLRFVRRMFVRWAEWLAARPLWIRLLVSLATLALVFAIVVAAWYLAGSPGL